MITPPVLHADLPPPNSVRHPDGHAKRNDPLEHASPDCQAFAAQLGSHDDHFQFTRECLTLIPSQRIAELEQGQWAKHGDLLHAVKKEDRRSDVDTGRNVHGRVDAKSRHS